MEKRTFNATVRKFKGLLKGGRITSTKLAGLENKKVKTTVEVIE